MVDLEVGELVELRADALQGQQHEVRKAVDL